MRILVCDDDVAVMVQLGVALDADEVVEAYRVADAEAVAQTGSGRLDAVVVDRRLPDGDGLQLVRTLRRLPATSDVPIVVFTDGPGAGDAEAVLAAGADACLPKPFEPLELADLLRRLSMLSSQDRRVRRTVRRARARAGRPSAGWDDLPVVDGGGGAVAPAPPRQPGGSMSRGRGRWRR